MADEIAKQLSPEGAVVFARCIAEIRLVEHPYPAEVHMLRRELLVEQALSPSSPAKGVIERDGYKEVDWESMPLFNTETRAEAGLEPADYDDEKGKLLVRKALDGDEDADAALSEIAFQHIWRQRRLPPHLTTYLMVMLRRRFEAQPKRGRGRYSPHQNITRDFVIVDVVSKLQEFGYHPTRARASHGSEDKEESGCSIVAKALAQLGIHISETGVEEVWSKRANLRY